ncbi:MAG TPA: GntG family PLP-dependent aldolase [Gaiellaceae bacterium]|nr:GntG family PLP-dependent aldolase [Gaiellaceae bacterium]
MIDLRSDTMTRPTAAMRAAMAAAEVGDEQLREDPTVNELQRRAAELVGQEAALFLPTATMANQIALRVLGHRGGEVVAEERTHVLVYEAGGAAANAGLVTRGLPGVAGRLTVAQLEEAVAAADPPLQPVELVVLEQTHRSSGGRVWPLEELEAVARGAHELGLRVHLDGARLLNASVAAAVPAAAYGGVADTVTLCFSKGLGCPLGAVLAGAADLIERAWVEKFRFGGAMRQAGIVAAAALYALDHHVERLAEDHARARRLAEGLAEAGLPVDPEATETNFIAIRLEELGLHEGEALRRLEAAGVLLTGLRPGWLRAVTCLDVEDEHVERAVELVPQALGALARA